MKITRSAFVLLLALCAAPAWADELDFGMDLAGYPQMVLVPGYPVYYAPEVEANYFFYDGEFWLYQDDNWYDSPWYDGPWERVDPEQVPDVILQIPIRYYVAPPAFFFIWTIEESPHWGEHWGHEWERHRQGWDRHDWHNMGKPAPLPDYQRRYFGDRYPKERDQQHELQRRNYRYQAHDPFVLQHRQIQPPQIVPTSPSVNLPPETVHTLHRHIEQHTSQGTAPGQAMPQQERRSATTQPGTIQREQVIRRNQGEARRPGDEGEREKTRDQEQDRDRSRDR